MDLQPTPTQAAFRAEVRAFIQQHLPAGVRARMRRGHAARKDEVVAWQRALHERGWAAPHWPREHGGTVLLRYGTETQKRFFLPRLASLDLWFCKGFSESGSGSDLASLRTRAVRQGDHYAVDGQKIWTTSAHVADWIFALVRTLVAAGVSGVKLRGYRLFDDTQAGELALEGTVAEPLGNVANATQALAAIRSTTAAGTAAACADRVGAMESAFALTRAYVGTRKQFGKPIGDTAAHAARLALRGA